MEGPVVVIRPYRREDIIGVHRVIMEGTMTPVNTFFIGFLKKEIFYQSIIMLSALMFIFGGIPLYWTITSLPIITVTSYLIIWAAHYYKAKYLHQDLKCIQKTYMGSDKTCFFVAEAFVNKTSCLSSSAIPSFLNEAEFENFQNIESTHKHREIIGTAAVCRDREFALVAWLRRMAVKKEWRQKGVGSHLVDCVIKFCNQRGFHSIELVTTECHTNGRRLYEKKGFEMKQMYHKKFLHMSSLAITMFFMSFKTRPHYRGTVVES